MAMKRAHQLAPLSPPVTPAKNVPPTATETARLDAASNGLLTPPSSALRPGPISPTEPRVLDPEPSSPLEESEPQASPPLSLTTLPTEILLLILGPLLLSTTPLTLSHDPSANPPPFPAYRPTRATLDAHHAACPGVTPAGLPLPPRHHCWGLPGAPHADPHAYFCRTGAAAQAGLERPRRIVRPRARVDLLRVCRALHGPAAALLFGANAWVARDARTLAAFVAAAPTRARLLRDLHVVHLPPVAVVGPAWARFAEWGHLRRLSLCFTAMHPLGRQADAASGRPGMGPPLPSSRRQWVICFDVDLREPWEQVPGMDELLRLRGLEEVEVDGTVLVRPTKGELWVEHWVEPERGLGQLVRETLMAPPEVEG